MCPRPAGTRPVVGRRPWTSSPDSAGRCGPHCASHAHRGSHAQRAGASAWPVSNPEGRPDELVNGEGIRHSASDCGGPCRYGARGVDLRVGAKPHQRGADGERDRDPQDPARHRDHAGEPVLRHLLRDLPRCGRHPDAGRPPDGLRPRPAAHACVRPFHDLERSSNDGGPHGDGDAPQGHRRREDGRVRRRARSSGDGRSAGRTDPNDPHCPARSHEPDVMGYHTAREIPNYWTYAQRLRAAGPHVRTESRRGACPRTCSWCRRGRRAARHPATRCRCKTRLSRRGRRHPATPAPRAASTPGPTSPSCSTSTASRGGTTWQRRAARLRPTTR